MNFKNESRKKLIQISYNQKNFKFFGFVKTERGKYRVFKRQVGFLKVAQLGAPWTNLHKFFFSDFLLMYIFCQVTKKKDFGPLF